MKLKISALLLVWFSCALQAQPAAVDSADHDQMMAQIGQQAAQSQEMVEIAVLVYEDIVLQDFAGPLEVFSKATNLTHGMYRVFTVANQEGPLHTENGLLEITPDYSIANMPDADYLIIPGASMPVINELMTQSWVTDFLADWVSRENAKTVSICTATYLLAQTGVLDGKKATTHFFVADDFESMFPEVEVIRDVRFVDPGEVLTSSGVTSGIDAAL